MVIKDLDIYDRVGYGVAHDEYIPFSLKNGQLKFGPHSSPFPGTLYVELVKVSNFQLRYFIVHILALKTNYYVLTELWKSAKNHMWKILIEPNQSPTIYMAN